MGRREALRALASAKGLRRHSDTLDAIPLLDGHPGVVVDSSWQDVGVVWVGLEHDDVTTSSVFDTRDLEQVAAEQFAHAVLRAHPVATNVDGGN